MSLRPEDYPPPTSELVEQCRERMAEIQRIVVDLNETTGMEHWSPHLWESYRLVLADMTTVGIYLQDLQDSLTDSAPDLDND